MAFSAADIKRMFELLNTELSTKDEAAEICLVGGAVLCLVYKFRDSTKDIDAYFKPASTVREAARRVASKLNVADDWLNDAVKGFLSEHGTFTTFLELSHLKVLVAEPRYLLAMKCLAMRIGEEFHDEADIRFLLRYLNLESYEKTIEIISYYYPLQRFPQKTLYALEEILAPIHK